MSKDSEKSYLIPVNSSLIVSAGSEAEAKRKAKSCIQSIGLIGGAGVCIFMEPGDPVEQIGTAETDKKD